MTFQRLQKQSLTQSQLLDEMTKVIVEVAAPEQVILFGSQTTGMAGPHSDYDFMVIVSEPFDEHRSRRNEAAKISWPLSAFGFPTDILMFSVEEVERWGKTLNHVVACALREGKVLYARSSTC